MLALRPYTGGAWALKTVDISQRLQRLHNGCTRPSVDLAPLSTERRDCAIFVFFSRDRNLADGVVWVGSFVTPVVLTPSIPGRVFRAIQ